jgi:predicted RecB family nuclease
MLPLITSRLIVAHLQCHRKAFLTLFANPKETQHHYEKILIERACDNRNVYLESINTLRANPQPQSSLLTKNQNGFIASKYFRADCDAISRSTFQNERSHPTDEPHLVVGTHSIAKEQRIRLAFAGFVIGETTKNRPKVGFLVPLSQEPKRIELEPLYPIIRTAVASLQKLIGAEHAEPPNLILNESCSTCPFQQRCLREAEESDNLSLLGRMTPKLISKYQAKGIFTVTQLSYLFKPRRRRKRQKKAPLVFNLELQALALRTRKTYLTETPIISDNPVEIFLDIEGIPDENFNYLIGLVIKDHGTLTSHSLWANSWVEENSIFEQLIKIVSSYPNAPIYHYGSYEPKALRKVEKRYEFNCKQLRDRLINVNSLIFGKVYFPSRSNRLKDLGRLLGATWDSPDASGIQSIVWRMQWERTSDPNIKKQLISYNNSDCHAVHILLSELRKITRAASDRDDVDFADNPHQRSTKEGEKIHGDLERIIYSAHAEYRRNRISTRSRHPGPKDKKAVGAAKGHLGYVRVVPRKVNRVIRVRRRLTCSSRNHRGQRLEPTGEDKEYTVIDLKFSNHGCSKVVTKYIGRKSRCPRCNYDYAPPAIRRLKGRLFWHSFQAWAIYQRVGLRLPYTAITAVIQNLFGEHITESSVVNFVRHMAEVYRPTEEAILRRILAGPFVHADETPISIRGVQHYVWVLTDGLHVVFRLTETRESSLVRAMLRGYRGVLVSDFYGGYDSVDCRQQKCVVHLIRDVNDDLWKNPFNGELEEFVGVLKDLLVPIFEDIEQYGLRARHLRKHTKSVDRFYQDRIDVQTSSCEIVCKYQERFRRYRESMFLFLREDGIPWNNNMAERAIRHLAIQRKISGSFYPPIATQYLRLLGIAQTCRFQNKSLLRYLLSEETEVDKYKEGKRPKSSRIVERAKADEEDE